MHWNSGIKVTLKPFEDLQFGIMFFFLCVHLFPGSWLPNFELPSHLVLKDSYLPTLLCKFALTMANPSSLDSWPCDSWLLSPQLVTHFVKTSFLIWVYSPSLLSFQKNERSAHPRWLPEFMLSFSLYYVLFKAWPQLV